MAGGGKKKWKGPKGGEAPASVKPIDIRGRDRKKRYSLKNRKKRKDRCEWGATTEGSNQSQIKGVGRSGKKLQREERMQKRRNTP